MSFYKIVDTEGEGIKLLGDLPSEGNTGDVLVWNYDYSKSTWLAAKGINFQSWSSGNEHLVNFQTKTRQGKNYNLLTSFEGIDPANPLTSYRIENYNKFRTLHNNDLAIVEINTKLANGALGGSFPNNANILIEYRKANPDGTIAEDNYLKLQQDSLHSNPIETNNFSIGFDGDFKVNKHASPGVTKVAAWDGTGKLIKTEFDPGTGGTGGATLPDAQEHRMLHGSCVFNQNIPSTWVMTNNMTYSEYADDAMDTLWTLSNSDMANTNETFNYSTIREHLTNYGLKSYFDMETIKGNTDSRAVLAQSTNIESFDDSASSGATYSIYDGDGESHISIGVNSKREYDVDADNWRILHDGGLKVDSYIGADENDIGDAYWDATGVLRRRATPTGSGIIHGQHRFQIYTDDTNELVIFRSDFRYIQNIRDNTNPLYDILKNINIYLIRNGGEYHHIPRHLILSDRILINFGDTPGMNGEYIDMRFSFDPVFPPPTGGPQT